MPYNWGIYFFLKSFIKYMMRFIINENHTIEKIWYFLCCKVQMSDITSFANKFLRTDPFTCNFKPSLPELTLRRDNLWLQQKELPIWMSKFIRNTLKGTLSFLSCSNFQDVELVLSSQKGNTYSKWAVIIARVKNPSFKGTCIPFFNM